MKLYQFPISHYCEKIRWTLDHKGIPYETINLVPGFHLLTTKRIAHETWVPILVDGRKVVQESSRIIDYLEEKYPQNPLTPKSRESREDAIKMESRLDQEIGIHLRRFFYFTLLNHREMVVELLTQGTNGYGKKLFPYFFPVVRKAMVMGMRINADSAQRSRDRLEKAMADLNRRLGFTSYLFGGKLSRVDITAASLLSPLCQPPEHEFQWPQSLPEPLAQFHKDHENDAVVQWVLKLYRENRPKQQPRKASHQ